MQCPKCSHVQAGRYECDRCGVVFGKLKRREEEAVSVEESIGGGIERLLGSTRVLLVDQHAREWIEILFDWEQPNEYVIRDGTGRIRGSLAEQGRGIAAALKRSMLGSHRPLHLIVFSGLTDEVVLSIERPFFWFLSEMTIRSGEGTVIGRVRRTFSFLRRRYDLIDRFNRPFARIVTRVFSIWSFPVVDTAGREVAVIRKEWSGLVQEQFTDADKFRIDFGDAEWTIDQKAVLFATALSIDFDFFENNRQR